MHFLGQFAELIKDSARTLTRESPSIELADKGIVVSLDPDLKEFNGLTLVMIGEVSDVEQQTWSYQIVPSRP